MVRKKFSSRRKVRKKAIFLRKWFLALAIVGALLLVGAYVGYTVVTDPYRERAEEYDMALVNAVELPNLIYDREDREIGRMFVENRSPVSIEEIPDKMVEALVSGEDSRFFEHNGVDYVGIGRATYLNIKSGDQDSGANTGQLACDILDTLAAETPSLYKKIQYTICEPLQAMCETQRQTLRKHIHKISHRAELSEITNPLPHAVLLSNELVDAFPVKILTKTNDEWFEKVVGLADGEFAFELTPLSSEELTVFAETLPSDLPEGYETEYRPGIESFAQICAVSLELGLVITIDYGHIYDDFYSTERTTGTLRTFYQHTAGENPLEHIAEQDITAHVDFTQLARAFSSADLEPSYFDTQSRYLTKHASSWFQKVEDSTSAPPSKLIRQFQTLTHPSMMGRQFHVLECVKSTSQNPQVLSRIGINSSFC